MKICLDIFEGPFDLLLYLIKKNHLDIHDIPLTVVVEQYLQFLELMKFLDVNIASEYLVMAATLINIKSKMILPQSQEQPEEDDPREELVRKLLEYEKIKEAAVFLQEKERQRHKYITRPAAENVDNDVYLEVSLFDLINAFKSAVKEVPRDIFFEIIKEQYTVEEKIHDILHLVLQKDSVALNQLFGSAKNKLEIVVIFLAILELIKLREIAAVQKGIFEEILIMRREKVYSTL